MTDPLRPLVLLVDDEVLVARLYARAVEAMGFEAQFAPNASEAIEYIENNPPNLLITDLNMPGMTGLELANYINQREEKTFPIIMASADDNVPLMIAGLSQGVDDFLVKGMPFSVFSERIRFWMDGPFRALPQHLRQSALEAFERVGPLGPPIKRLRAPAELLMERARVTMVDLLSQVPADFGMKETERIRFLGVLDRILSILARTNALAQLRRLDVMLDVIQRLPILWRARLISDQLTQLDALAIQPTFRHAYTTLALLP